MLCGVKIPADVEFFLIAGRHRTAWAPTVTAGADKASTQTSASAEISNQMMPRISRHQPADV